MLLNFSDRTGTGVFSMVWSLPTSAVIYGSHIVPHLLQRGRRRLSALMAAAGVF